MSALISRSVRRGEAGAVARSMRKKLGEVVSIEDFGGSPLMSGATNSAALAAAKAALAALGGGTICLPAGTINLANTGPGVLSGSGATSWDNRYCFQFTTDNIKIRGAGRGATVLKLGDGENAHVIQFGQRSGAAVAVSGCGVFDLSIDGNRANQTVPTETENHFGAINVSTGCSRVTLAHLHIYDAAYYGIGFQRDNIHFCLVDQVEIERTGADGMDAKDDTDTGTGNVVRGLRVRNWGLLAGISTGQAGLDLRSGWAAHNIDIAAPGSAGALNGIRLQNGTPGAIPVQPTVVHDFRVAGTNVAGSVGVRVITRYAGVHHGYVKAFGDGYSLSDPDSRFSHLTAEANATGFRLWQDAPAGVEADTACLVGLVARSNSAAGIVYDSVDEITVLGADVRSNTTIGHDIRAGCSGVRIIGGSATGSATNVSDAGTNTTVQFVSGARTKNVGAVSVAIDSTGIKAITIAHGLAFTPSLDDIGLTLKRNTNVGDWSAGFLWVTGADATNVTAQMRVLTASATVGAVVDVVASIEAKSRG